MNTITGQDTTQYAVSRRTGHNISHS